MVGRGPLKPKGSYEPPIKDKLLVGAWSRAGMCQFERLTITAVGWTTNIRLRGL